ncbi:hypothetical protein NQ317_002930 [Molorchus minor]|uniref:Uncharacterized protein n=1 Tax=Molorchus minor TaxID=1323400 RepID=A0ABQ9J694_9CUCU|nr:hypothetical protein NQ317_002930 [Molorchus minor]
MANEKKGRSIEERLKLITDNQLALEIKPHAIKKIVPINGDVKDCGLGLLVGRVPFYISATLIDYLLNYKIGISPHMLLITIYKWGNCDSLFIDNYYICILPRCQNQYTQYVLNEGIGHNRTNSSLSRPNY